ncbi:MAG: hypothetical protein GDA36_03805 [Rhodobacteraceae bacterium]|nr:hypothetical protein [Paracoccaceae bacterium]
MGKAVLTVWLCDCRCLRGEDDPVCGTPQVLPDRHHIATSASWTFCFDQPELSGGASSWHRHCAIPQAAVGDQHAPALFPGPQGPMTGGRTHDPVTVATAQASRLALLA